MTVDDMKEFEKDNRKVREHREQWENRWAEVQEEDATAMRKAERDMVRSFGKRGVGELDKRCWLVKTKKANLSLGQLIRLRRGELASVDWREPEPGADNEGYGGAHRAAYA
ncbi:hypothetical protein Q9L58_008808 [Maublancomyces gigas]|uniref:Uncharacterized protein n=1 Tax=Discina gigas TaxID=1032678 RepID=A0ABR3G8Y7_9PEZI